MQTFCNVVLKNRGLSRKECRNRLNYFSNLDRDLDEELKAYMMSRRSNIRIGLINFWTIKGRTPEAKSACGRWTERNGVTC